MSDHSHKLTDLIEASLQKIKEFATSEVVIGEPIETNGGVTVIPVSKVSMGFASGGLDYSGKRRSKDGAKEYSDGEPHFGGGGGTGIKVSPVAFLIISPSGKVDLLPLTSSAAAADSSVDKLAALIERAPELIEKVKGAIGKKKKNVQAEKESKTDDALACDEDESAAD